MAYNGYAIDADHYLDAEAVTKKLDSLIRKPVYSIRPDALNEYIENYFESIKVNFIEAKENLRTKVVLDGTSTEELYQSIKIESSIRQGANGALIVSAALKTDYQPTGVPENVKICIDGTLHGQVYAGQVFVGAVTLPLPLFGVECGNNISGKTETLCPYYAINNQPYSVTWSPNRLWLMEV